MYASNVPRLWTDTIETHRQEVQDAILDATARLADEHGLTAVSMSDVATAAGIGRATLYKYFASVEVILVAWHEKQIQAHLTELRAAAERGSTPAAQLTAALGTYAHICHRHHGTDLAAAVHHRPHMHTPRAELHAFITDLIATAANTHQVRRDVPPAELATYALAAVGAANELGSNAAVDRLVQTVTTGMAPQQS